MFCGDVWGHNDGGERWVHRKMMHVERYYVPRGRSLAQLETNGTDTGQCLLKVAYKATYIQGNNAYYLSQFVLGDVSNSVCCCCFFRVFFGMQHTISTNIHFVFL